MRRVVCHCGICGELIAESSGPNLLHENAMVFTLALIALAVRRGKTMVCHQCKGSLAPLTFDDYKRG